MDLRCVCLSEDWHERQKANDYFKKSHWRNVEDLTTKQKKVMRRIYRNISAHLRNTEDVVVSKSKQNKKRTVVM